MSRTPDSAPAQDFVPFATAAIDFHRVLNVPAGPLAASRAELDCLHEHLVSLHGLLRVDPVDPAAEPPVAPRLVVARCEGETWAFAADEVAGVRHVAADDLRPVPSTLANPAGSFGRAVFGWRDRSVNVLDESRLFVALRRMGHEQR